MVGKATLIVIMGFSLIFGVASQYWNRSSTTAIDNFVDYYDTTAAHNIAVSAANIAADSLFLNPAMTSLGLSGGVSGGFFNTSTSQVDISGTEYVQILSASRYQGRRGWIRDTVKVILRLRTFNAYAFFSISENNTNWITGDTLWGPFHTEGEIFVSGRPVFYGRVTNSAPKFVPNSTDAPYFYGGYQSGVSVTMPADISSSASLATKTFTNTDSYYKDTYDVFLDFNSDGTVTFHTKAVVTTYGTSGRPTGTMITTTTPDSTVQISEFGNVVLINNGDAHVSGTVDGNITVVAQQGTGRSATATSGSSTYDVDLYNANGGTRNGNILIGGNLIYKDDPRAGASNDMLGLVADNSVALLTQPSASDVNIDGAIFARQGKFLYLDWNGETHDVPMGTLRLYGSISNQTRGAVGSFGGVSTLQSGYLKNYKYDDRFYSSSPPAFPGTNNFQIVAWRE